MFSRWPALDEQTQLENRNVYRCINNRMIVYKNKKKKAAKVSLNVISIMVMDASCRPSLPAPNRLIRREGRYILFVVVSLSVTKADEQGPISHRVWHTRTGWQISENRNLLLLLLSLSYRHWNCELDSQFGGCVGGFFCHFSSDRGQLNVNHAAHSWFPLYLMMFFHIQLSGMMMRVWDRETSRGVKEPPGHEIDGQLKVRWIGRTCLGVWPWCRGVTSTMMEATDGVAECQTIQDAWIASLVVDNFDVALCVSLHLVLSLSLSCSS